MVSMCMSAPAYNGQGSEGEHLLSNHEVPLKLTTFSYFRDQFLNKKSYICKFILHGERVNMSAPPYMYSGQEGQGDKVSLKMTTFSGTIFLIHPHYFRI